MDSEELDQLRDLKAKREQEEIRRKAKLKQEYEAQQEIARQERLKEIDRIGELHSGDHAGHDPSPVVARSGAARARAGSTLSRLLRSARDGSAGRRAASWADGRLRHSVGGRDFVQRAPE